MAFRIRWLDRVGSLAGILAAVRGRLGAGTAVKRPGVLRGVKVEGSRKGVDRRLQARVEAQKSLAILYHRTIQVR